ncbi:hypothetical protein GUITHDRAFT_109326 [Guillardia theta CCMP2712]|uniref:Uncharacterized protein n=1 Tax=Guillardia theta (strain CCMP2712) TaxID=905079 RepID=L1J9C1_GUITC|nr:hypothetical protein GUITHDRAFT_109326 [Guillardia theta CCMP2712]EKX44907.1 hypothetical protein GUITHDRAFT_109326 [Guillardia theta CCMP2712]|eukprot:XP_005831887.1 hypothetical protein GUITHDRAFT_109326 [Guillardia theta CCMP2712]
MMEGTILIPPDDLSAISRSVVKIVEMKRDDDVLQDSTEEMPPRRPSIDQAGWKSFLAHPFRSAADYMKRLEANFGWKFLVMLLSAYFGVKGALYTFTGLVQLPYYKKLGVDGRQYQIYGSIAVTPFAMKGFFGTISDVWPMAGYHKNSYILLAAALGSLSFLLLGSFKLSAGMSACLFFLASVETAVVDLLCEGKYAELMRMRPHTGGDIVTWVWATYHVGSLCAAGITGPISDKGHISSIFWICFPIAAQVMIPVALGWLSDPVQPASMRGFRWNKFKEHQKLFGLALCMALAALVQAIINLYFSKQIAVQLGYTITVSAVLCVMAGGALDYWFTAEEECVPGGPHFDYTYYSTYVRIVGSIAAWAGVILFQAIMGNWRLRRIFWVSVVLRCAGGIFDILIVNRDIGQDHVHGDLFCGSLHRMTGGKIGDAIIYEVCYTLNFMPAVVLTSKLCAKDLEATTYAMLAGFQNFGQQVSRTVGVFFITIFNIRTDAPCSWDGLSLLIAVAHIFLPLLLVPLTFYLIPDLKITDDLLGGTGAPQEEEEESDRREREMSNVSDLSIKSDRAPLL